jgi:hypothetical protein
VLARVVGDPAQLLVIETCVRFQAAVVTDAFDLRGTYPEAVAGGQDVGLSDCFGGACEIRTSGDPRRKPAKPHPAR